MRKDLYTTHFWCDRPGCKRGKKIEHEGSVTQPENWGRVGIVLRPYTRHDIIVGEKLWCDKCVKKFLDYPPPDVEAES